MIQIEYFNFILTNVFTSYQISFSRKQIKNKDIMKEGNKGRKEGGREKNKTK